MTIDIHSEISLGSEVPGLEKLPKYSADYISELILNKNKKELLTIVELFVRHIAEEKKITITEDRFQYFLENTEIFFNLNEYFNFEEEVERKTISQIERFTKALQVAGFTNDRVIYYDVEDWVHAPYLFLSTQYVNDSKKNLRLIFAQRVIHELWHTAERYFDIVDPDYIKGVQSLKIEIPRKLLNATKNVRAFSTGVMIGKGFVDIVTINTVEIGVPLGLFAFAFIYFFDAFVQKTYSEKIKQYMQHPKEERANQVMNEIIRDKNE